VLPQRLIRTLAPYLAALLSVALTLALVGGLQAQAGTTLPTALLLYLVPIILAATRWGRGPAIVAVLTAVVGDDLFFVEPIGTLSIARADEGIGLVLLLFTAIVTAELADEARRGAEKEREASIARRSDELKTSLLHAVSHDLRTPLASIKASASGLRQPDADYSPDDRAELLGAIEEAADRLDRLVSNLLDASRLEAGVLRPHKQPQELGELAESVLARLQPLLEGRLVTLQVAPDLPLVDCDYTEIDQVFTNLIENAARHTPVGTPIEVRLCRTGQYARIDVVDHGPGIPPQQRERLMRPFERGSTLIAGSGLGLAIARGLVEAHGGRLWVEDGVPSGARFVFTLPLGPAV
jgi:two-component system, OmpR family, sensor histidine kinase KdpD